MKKLSHSFAKVSHSYKKGVALVGMRHLKTAFINMRFLSCVSFKDNRDNRDNSFSYRNFCFNDNRDIFLCVMEKQNQHIKNCLYCLYCL